MKMEYLKSLQIRQRILKKISMFFAYFEVQRVFLVYFIVSQELLSKKFEAKEGNHICLSLNKQVFQCPLFSEVVKITLP